MEKSFRQQCDPDTGKIAFDSFLDVMWDALEKKQGFGSQLLALESPKTRKRLEKPLLVARSGGGV